MTNRTGVDVAAIQENKEENNLYIICLTDEDERTRSSWIAFLESNFVTQF